MIRLLKLTIPYLVFFIFSLGLIKPSLAQSENYLPQDKIHIHILAPLGADSDQVSRLVAGRIQRIFGHEILIDNQSTALQQAHALNTQNEHPLYSITVIETGRLHQETKGKSTDTESSTTDEVPLSRLLENADYVPLDSTITSPYLLVSNQDTEFKNLEQLIDYLEQKPESLSIAATPSTPTKKLSSFLNKDIKIVEFESQASALDALLANKVQLAFLKPAIVKPLLATEKLSYLTNTINNNEIVPATIPDDKQSLLFAHKEKISSINNKILFVISDKIPEDMHKQISTVIAKILNEAIIAKLLHAQYMKVSSSTDN